MKNIKFLIICILLSFQFVSAQNTLEGTWVYEMNDTKQVMLMKAKEYTITTSRIGERDTTETIQIVHFLPMVQDTGKYIIEIKTEFQTEYYIHYYFSVSKDQFKLFRGYSQFFSLEEALVGAKEPITIRFYERYMSKSYYEEYNKRPTMPKPDKKTILAAFDMAIEQGKAIQKSGKRADVNQIMNDWVEKQGFHAARSQKVFQEALSKLQADPEIKDKLDEFIQLTR